MNITTKYNIGQIMLWNIGNKPLIIVAIKVLSATHHDYICSYADSDGNPKESTFVETEIEPWNGNGIGFKKNEEKMP